MRALLREFLGRLWSRRDTGPIDSEAAVARFVAGHAAFVAQKTLYGYLKTRMGTRYPSMFEDDVFTRSVDIAKMNVYAACLSDLSIFAVAHALADGSDDARRRELARHCVVEALAENAAGAPPEFAAGAAIESFFRRLDGIDWADGALSRDNFTESPKALYRWAPIAPELKEQDADIVQNSISFAWSEVRQSYLRRLDPAAVQADGSA